MQEVTSKFQVGSFGIIWMGKGGETQKKRAKKQG